MPAAGVLLAVPLVLAESGWAEAEEAADLPAALGVHAAYGLERAEEVFVLLHFVAGDCLRAEAALDEDVRG